MSNLLHPYNYWESNGQYYFDAPSGAPLSCPVVTGHFCRWAKAAGEESPSGMLLPAAGAAVAARPAIWRAALPTNRTLMGKV